MQGLKRKLQALATALVIACSIGVVTAPAASAHYGDWTQQYNTTRSQLSSEWGYYTSHVYDYTHSRYFYYRNYYYIDGRCYFDTYRFGIDHNNGIWSRGILDRYGWC